MAQQPDLTLPERVPEMEQYHHTPTELLPFAFYTLCDLDDTKMEAYRQLCETGVGDDDGDDEYDSVRLPPRARFPNGTLRDIVKYHVELAAEGKFDYNYFIVAVYPDSYTVLLVTLDDDDLECKPDLLWINMDESGLALVNLQIANEDWFEVKEHRADGPRFQLPTPAEDDQ